ncbi:hypothetical protein A8W25_24880 [Streptomyces sp. ERV7]|uniref:hypothetical protein n=1 Tax=Streptomyces sp. ERV7 TaxID=1322334 RepID=UPI0007F44C51|nr:hypothetical protein [Streptomyces sp. ERV7]OAR22810.1 hypothetical protein A8W25_24880 [Streptomyces sp. ERV7]
MKTKRLFAASLVAGAVLAGGTATGPAQAAAPNTTGTVSAKKCSSGVDQPWSGSGRAYTYGWNTCTYAGWSQFKLWRNTGGKYREVARSGTYWSKFGGRSISAKCAKGGHWYVASLTQTNVAGTQYTSWSRASWLGSC